jgi:ferredoxin
MTIKKIWIDEDCIACGLCIDICPDVFELEGDIAIVKHDVDFNQFEDEIIEAAESCPVEVIHYE